MKKIVKFNNRTYFKIRSKSTSCEGCVFFKGGPSGNCNNDLMREDPPWKKQCITIDPKSLNSLLYIYKDIESPKKIKLI